MGELGRGGFGVVLLAVDPMLGREVALKVPRPEVLITEATRRRFLREAEAASRLDHPHIVPTYEVGQEGPICFIASAYCRGPTLAEWQRGRAEPVRSAEVARLVAVLAEAVAHAHGRGILHRDLKPGNILLQPGEGEGEGGDPSALGAYRPRICDFGLAKLLDDASQETCSGLAIGSPPYMAPEQAEGKIREQGPATDVYALGVILYELLTGRPPLRGETDLETLRLVSDREPLPPRSLRPGLPRDLETICLKCLEKRPQRRYAGTAELAQDLGRFLEGRPIRARRASAWERTGKWAHRRPSHAAIAAIAAVVVLGVLGGLGWAQARERRHGEEVRAKTDQILRLQLVNQLKRAASSLDRGDRPTAQAILDDMVPAPGAADVRGFPWYYLARACSTEIEKLPPGVLDPASEAACSDDGRTIGLSNHTQGIVLVNRATGRARALGGGERDHYQPRVRFSPDGRLMASISYPRSGIGPPAVKLWDVATGRELSGMANDFGHCYEIVFSPDGGTVVTVEVAGSNPRNPVRSWRPSSDRERVRLVEALRADQIPTELAVGRRRRDAGGRPFELSDAVAVTAGDEPVTAAFHPGGVIWLYRSNGYYLAAGRVAGDEVVVLPRNDAIAPYGRTELQKIERAARELTGCAVSDWSATTWQSHGRGSRPTAGPRP